MVRVNLSYLRNLTMDILPEDDQYVAFTPMDLSTRDIKVFVFFVQGQIYKIKVFFLFFILL